MTETPETLRYSRDHVWVRWTPGGIAVRAGLTDFAQQSLGDVVAVTLPAAGESLEPGRACGDVESTKSVNDIVAPVRGRVTAVNAKLVDAPELVNTDPYGAGWLFDAEVSAEDMTGEPDALLTAKRYAELFGG